MVGGLVGVWLMVYMVLCICVFAIVSGFSAWFDFVWVGII